VLVPAQRVPLVVNWLLPLQIRLPHERPQYGPDYLLPQDLNALLERVKEDIEVKEEDEHVMDLETDLDDVLQNYEEAIVVIVSPPCFALEVPYLTQLTSISTVREQKLVQQSIFI
jgi:hypothetical protein